jgi:hypothetical protein
MEKSRKFITIILRAIMIRGSIVALVSDEALYIVAHIDNGFVFIHKLRGSKKILKLPFDSVKLLIL